MIDLIRSFLLLMRIQMNFVRIPMNLKIFRFVSITKNEYKI
jgi:hypothetical protein